MCEQPPASGFAASAAIDCAVPIVTDEDPTYLFAKAVDTAFGAETTCTVQLDGVAGLLDGPALLCEDLGSNASVDEPRDIRLIVEFDDVGSLGVRDSVASDELRVLTGQALPDGVPLRFNDPAGADRTEPLNLVVRERRTGREVTRVDASALDRDGRDTAAELDLPVGLYRFWPCLGDDVTTCDEQPGGYAFEVISPALSPLPGGRNSDPNGRINLVFVGSDLDSARWDAADTDLATLATEMLGLDGPVRIDEVRNPSRPDQAFGWGPFSIEPLKSNAGKFNFWVLDQSVQSVGAFGTLPSGDGPVDRGLGLPNVSIVHVSGTPDTRGAFADVARFGSEAAVPPRDELVFGNANMFVIPPSATSNATVLSHELGHSLFGLSDEYFGDDGPNTGSWNCVATRADAEAKWGGLLGDVDPFAQEVLDQLVTLGIDVSQFDLVDDTTARVTQGGCDGPEDGQAFRPSEESLMKFQVPVFGAGDRARVDAVLDRFDAATPDASDDDAFVVSTEPARLIDSRENGRTIDGRFAASGALEPGEVVEIQIAGRHAIPDSGVEAAVLNVTAARPDNGGYFTVYPCTDDAPLASSLNFDGANAANEIIAELADDGTVCVFSSTTADLVVDVVGWIPEGSDYSGVQPARLADTRSTGQTVDDESEQLGLRDAGGVTEIQIAGRGGIPADGVDSAVFNLTAVRPGGRGFVTVHPCADDIPVASSLNVAGSNRGNELTPVSMTGTRSMPVRSSRSRSPAETRSRRAVWTPQSSMSRSYGPRTPATSPCTRARTTCRWRHR